MKVTVNSCWGGHDFFSFRLTLPDGSRESVRGIRWDRSVATEALDLLEKVYGLKRTAIRFVHH